MGAKNISDDDLYLGIDVIDDEHRELLDVINRLVAASCAGSDARFVDNIAFELIAGIQAHFRSEEGQMAAWSYDGLARHKAAHAELFDSLETLLLANRFTTGSNLADALVGFLQAWLGDHILGDDKRLADFLKARGIE